MTANERGTDPKAWPAQDLPRRAAVPQGPSPCSSTSPAGWLRYLNAIFLLLLLGVLIVGIPGRIDRQRLWLQVTTCLMIGFITDTTARAATGLVQSIFAHASFTSAVDLFTAGTSGVADERPRLRAVVLEPRLGQIRAPSSSPT